MVFSSPVFLFLFLPIVFIAYFVSGKILRNAVLLLSSLVFYFWGEQLLIVYLLLSVFVNYLIALFIYYPPSWTNNPFFARLSYSKILLIISILFNLGMLFYFKYSSFFAIDILEEMFGIKIQNWVNIALPIGISFYTFQAMSYVIDVYRGDVPATKNPITFGCYLTSFPQLIAGPIIRYKDVSVQLKKRIINVELLYSGVVRFIIGLSKKVLIADSVGQGVDMVFNSSPEMLNPLVAWVGAIGYAIQIYFDFSGYSDMAIGLGRIFGFRFLENFNFPYISKTIQEFWRRWHISLSKWFRDYLYIPLGGNKKGAGRTYINLVIVFGLCGLWHGASWNFIVWGLYHGFFLIIERLGLNKLLDKSPKWLNHVYVLVVVIIGWVFFRAEDLGSSLIYLQTMFGMGNISNLSYQVFFDRDMILFLLLGILFSYPIHFINMNFEFLQKSRFKVFMNSVKVVLLLFLLFLSISKIVSGTFSPFLYFRF